MILIGAIMEFWLNQIGVPFNAVQNDKAVLQSLRLLAEEAKKSLSVRDDFKADWSGYQCINQQI
jgi:molecular chaperone HscA